VAPLFFAPRSFESIAITAIGAWTAWTLAVPGPAQIPSPIDADRNLNMSRPIYRDTIERQSAHFAPIEEEPDQEAAGTSAAPPRTKRSRATAGKAAHASREPSPTREQVPAGTPNSELRHRARIIRRFYDSQTTEGAPRGDTLAVFTSLNISE